MITAAGKQAQRIVVAGDSIAYGRGDYRGTGWAGMLQKVHLAQDPENHRYFNLSIPGVGTADMHRIVHSEIPFRSPDLVILAYGINDARRIGAQHGPLPATPDEVANSFADNVEHLRQAGAAVCVIGLIPPDPSRTMPCRSMEITSTPDRHSKWKRDSLKPATAWMSAGFSSGIYSLKLLNGSLTDSTPTRQDMPPFSTNSSTPSAANSHAPFQPAWQPTDSASFFSTGSTFTPDSEANGELGLYLLRA